MHSPRLPTSTHTSSKGGLRPSAGPVSHVSTLGKGRSMQQQQQQQQQRLVSMHASASNGSGKPFAVGLAASPAMNSGTMDSTTDEVWRRSNDAWRRSDHQKMFTREDYDMLPPRIILIRHAESQGNVERNTYCIQPDHMVVLTERGKEQARAAGRTIKSMLEQVHGDKYRLFIMTSPYTRTLETTDGILEPFSDDQVMAVRSAVQLREQDFGNFQDPQRITQDLSDRVKFGRFWFRFPNGESGADVYDRLTVFEDHLTRDMMMGRFANSTLVMVTHGLTLRIFLMRWFHWTVEDFLQVYNPGNCDPVVLEKHPWEIIQKLQGNKWVHVKQCYAMTKESRLKLKGTTVDMSDYLPRKLATEGAKTRWIMQRAAQKLGLVESQQQQQAIKEACLQQHQEIQQAAEKAVGVPLPPLPLAPGLGFLGPLACQPGVRATASLALRSVEDPYGSLSEDEAMIDWWKAGVARSVFADEEAEGAEGTRASAVSGVSAGNGAAKQ